MPSWVAKCTDTGKNDGPSNDTVNTAWAGPDTGRTIVGSDTDRDGIGMERFTRMAAQESALPGVTVMTPVEVQFPQNTMT